MTESLLNTATQSNFQKAGVMFPNLWRDNEDCCVNMLICFSKGGFFRPISNSNRTDPTESEVVYPMEQNPVEEFTLGMRKTFLVLIRAKRLGKLINC